MKFRFTGDYKRQRNKDLLKGDLTAVLKQVCTLQHIFKPLSRLETSYKVMHGDCNHASTQTHGIFRCSGGSAEPESQDRSASLHDSTPEQLSGALACQLAA